MTITDIACIIVVCVAANHLGLISAIEDVLGRRLPIVNCPKCLTFWVTLGYGCDNISTYGTTVLQVLAISFLCAWLAVWLELGMGVVDYYYMKVYETIYESSADDEATTGADGGCAAGKVSDV